MVRASPGAAIRLLLLLLELLAKLLKEEGAPLCVSEVTVMASGHNAGIVPAKSVPALPACTTQHAVGVSKLGFTGCISHGMHCMYQCRLKKGVTAMLVLAAADYKTGVGKLQAVILPCQWYG
jgi:hypothetical protein